MNRVQYVITVDSDKNLTKEQRFELMCNMHGRLQGYHTETPDFLRNFEMEISVLKDEI